MAVQSSFKNMSLCLFVICLVCSGLLAGVYALFAYCENIVNVGVGCFNNTSIEKLKGVAYNKIKIFWENYSYHFCLSLFSVASKAVIENAGRALR